MPAFPQFGFTPTFYAPGPGDAMEGPWATSRPNPYLGGQRVPSTLDDVRLGRSPYVTVASDPSRYGQTVNFGSITYRSPVDSQMYTLPNVQGYVHDTGSAFQGRPDKLDIAAGDFRGWSPTAASAFVARNQASDIQAPQAAQAEGKVPSLLDMFTPSGGYQSLVAPATGQPTDFAGMLGQRQNSLIGMGLGLMGGGWAGGMQGFQAGARQDALNAYEGQRLRESALDRALRARHQQFIEQEAGITPFQRMQRDIEAARGTSREEDVKAFYAPQLGTQAQLTTITDPNDPDSKINVLYHPRAPAGSQITDLTGRPIPGLGGTVAGAAPAPVPFAGAGGLGGYAGLPSPVQPGGGLTSPVAPPTATAPSGAAAARGLPSAATLGPTVPGLNIPDWPTARSPVDLPARTGPKAFEPEQKLRKEFEEVSKPHMVIRDAFARMQAAEPTGPGDLAMLYSYIKMINPNNRLSPNAVADAENTAGVPDQIRNLWNKVLKGDRLSPAHRQEVMRQAASLYGKSLDDYNALREQFGGPTGIARQQRIDPGRVLPNFPPLSGGGDHGGGGVVRWGRDAQGNPIPLRE